MCLFRSISRHWIIATFALANKDVRMTCNTLRMTTMPSVIMLKGNFCITQAAYVLYMWDGYGTKPPWLSQACAMQQLCMQLPSTVRNIETFCYDINTGHIFIYHYSSISMALNSMRSERIMGSDLSIQSSCRNLSLLL